MFIIISAYCIIIGQLFVEVIYIHKETRITCYDIHGESEIKLRFIHRILTRYIIAYSMGDTYTAVH